MDASQEDKKKKDPPFTLALIAGAVAGTTVDVSLHPLDTLRTRMQSSEGFWKAGGFQGTYRGVLSAFLASGPGAALFFSTYESSRSLLKSANGGVEHWSHPSVASTFGEITACLIRVPAAVATQNMQIGHFKSLTEAMTSTYKTGGILKFYEGYSTTVMREIPFSFIQFPVYEGLKKAWGGFQGSETSPNQGAICGSIAGAIASACTTPLDVARTRIITEHPAEGMPKKYSGPVQTLKIIAAEEGPLALFKGIVPRVGWITVGGFIFFGAYEWAKKGLWTTGLWGKEYDE